MDHFDDNFNEYLETLEERMYMGLGAFVIAVGLALIMAIWNI